MLLRCVGGLVGHLAGDACAVFSLQNGQEDLAAECLELYFGLDPPANQLLVRAYLCQALIATAKNPANEVCTHTALRLIASTES